MKTDTIAPSPAYLIATEDRRLQAYLQTDPFLVGYDPALRQETFELLKRGPVVRHPSKAAEVTTLEPGDAPMPDDVREEVLRLGAAFGIADTAAMINDYWWKVAVIDAEPQRVLAVGCGGGNELVLLRAAFPKAEIHAVDWGGGPALHRLKAAGVTFRRGDLHDLLTGDERFNLVFSNHTIEHMCDPGAILARLRSVLLPGGMLVSALPLDGTADDAYAADLARWAARPSRISPIDMGWINVGHPWKTNAPDLVEMLGEAGFDRVQVYRRADALVRYFPLDEVGLAAFRRRRRLPNRWLFRPLTRLFAPFAGMRLARKALVAIDRRLRWGDHRFKNNQAPEVVFIARV